MNVHIFFSYTFKRKCWKDRQNVIRMVRSRAEGWVGGDRMKARLL